MNKILTYLLGLSIAVISAEGIIIDGSLDEPEWEEAFVIDKYYEAVPYTLKTPDVKTVTRIISNEEHLWIFNLSSKKL